MNFYLDASCIVPLFAPEPSSMAVADVIEAADNVIVSDHGLGETSSAIARKFREGIFSQAEVLASLADLDRWTFDLATMLEASPADVRRGQALVRRFDLGLRFADALHIAIAERCGARLLTRDRQMATAAATLAVPVRLLE